jgi:hypothetical protein
LAEAVTAMLMATASQCSQSQCSSVPSRSHSIGGSRIDRETPVESADTRQEFGGGLPGSKYECRDRK